MLIDISRTISGGALIYPGDPAPRIERLHSIAGGSPVNTSRLEWTTHVLTHMDVPRHFSDSGDSITDLPPERFIGPALVIAIDGPAVLPEHIPAAVSGVSLLFKTRHSGPWDPEGWDAGHVYISPEAARTIAERGANLAGIDYLDVERHGDDDFPTHRTLLSSGVLILEGIDLSGVEPGPYTLVALPLKIEGGDGSPVRAVLMPADAASPAG